MTALVLATSFVAAFAAQFDLGLLPEGARHNLAAYRVLWPQRWWFFTDLDQNVLVPYRVGAGASPTPLHPRRLWDEQWGGFSRVGDTWANETRRVALLVPDRYWQQCGPDNGDPCSGLDLAHVFPVPNPVGHPTLCGTVAIAVEGIVLTGSTELPREPRRVLHMAVLDIRCVPR